MTLHHRFTTAAAVLALHLCTLAVPAAAGASTRDDSPAVPAALEVPAGHVAYLTAYAVGTQNYVCVTTTAGTRWTFVGPQATLYLRIAHGRLHQVATHFLSVNPQEAATARPTWQQSFDTSRVWARAIASSSDPAWVEAGAIPWLLLEVTGREPGPVGGALLARTTYLQRIHTTGGVAPSTGCSTPAEAGALALVPYTTDYVFFRAAR